VQRGIIPLFVRSASPPYLDACFLTTVRRSFMAPWQGSAPAGREGGEPP